MTFQAMAVNFYRARDGPRYILGHSVNLGFVCAGIIASLILVFNYTKINRSRARALANGGDIDISAKELSAQGDRAVTWRYTL
jgi:hypothetical protein